MFLAEQELYDGIIRIAEGFINESTGLISLNEGFKETISKYITKISTALENAWNKFKAIVERDKDKNFLAKIANKIINSNPDFVINNYQEINTNALDNFAIVPFNYDQMKDDLDTIERFEKKYYGNLLKDPNKSLKENIIALPISSRKNGVKCTNDMLKKMYTFLTKEFPSKMNKLKADLKVVSDSNNTIQNLSNTVSSTSESIAFYRYYIREDENTQLAIVNKNTSVATTNNSNTPKFEDGKNHDNSGNSNFVKRVTNYIKVCVDIITGKMSALKNMFTYYLKIIVHFISPKSVSTDNSTEQTTQVATVKTTINTQ